MHEILKKYVGKTLRIYTISGVESYLGTLEEVHEGYIRLTQTFSKDTTFLATQYIESFKEETRK